MVRINTRAALFLSLLGVLLVAPIWLVAYPPLLDYPNHLARTFVLARLHEPASHFRQFYQADWGLYPYLSADLILVALNQVLPAALAGRIFISFCVLALPLAAWFFIRQANPGQDHMALWALVMAHNIFFIYAFLNFYLSLSVCFLTLGLWLSYLARPGLLRWCGMAHLPVEIFLLLAGEKALEVLGAFLHVRCPPPTFRARQFASLALRLASNRAIKEQFNLSIQRAVLPRKRAENYAD